MFTKEIIKEMAVKASSEFSPAPIWLKERIRRPKTFIYYGFLFMLSRHFKPKLVVETGCNQGISAAHFKLGNRSTRVVTIDINIPHHVRQFLKDQEIEFIAEDSVTALQSFPDGIGINILFLDSLHTYKHVKDEYNTALSKMEKGGLILFDDIKPVERKTNSIKGSPYFQDPGVSQFWNELPDNKIDLTELHPTSGYGGIIV